MMKLMVILLVCIQTFIQIHGIKISACFSQQQKSLDITCPVGSMVRILQTFYGVSQTDKCMYSPGDCRLKEDEKYSCVGREQCSINLPTGSYGRLVPSCGQYSNYFQVEYECVEISKTYGICDASILTDQSGYISTPRYPNNFHNNLSCSIQIQAQPGQKILLTIIDMELQPRGKKDCSDFMYFNDGFHSTTLCGRRSEYTFRSHGNHFQIELKAETGNSKGFWLYYEAVPKMPKLEPITDSTNEMTWMLPISNPNNNVNDNKNINNKEYQHEDTGVSTTSMLSSTLTTRNVETTPIPIYHDYIPSSGISKTLPFAAIAGGVIGTLTLVLLVLLTLLVIKWLKEKRYFQNKERFLEIRNPAFRSSGDFNQCNNEYNPYTNNDYCYVECA